MQDESEKLRLAQGCELQGAYIKCYKWLFWHYTGAQQPSYHQIFLETVVACY